LWIKGINGKGEGGKREKGRIKKRKRNKMIYTRNAERATEYDINYRTRKVARKNIRT
jgi:hypothetical protein